MKRKKRNGFIKVSIVLLLVALTTFSFISARQMDSRLEGQVECKKSTSQSTYALTQFPNLNFMPESPLMFMVKGQFTHSTTLNSVINAHSINDFYPDYPNNWIDRYKKVILSLQSSEFKAEATSYSNKLSVQQREMLKSAKLFTDVGLEVHYEVINSLTKDTTVEVLHKTFTIVPQQQAYFKEGNDKWSVFLMANAPQQLIHFLEEKSYQITEQQGNNSNFSLCTLNFTIDTKGHLTEVNIQQTSGNNLMDQQLVELLKTSPRWVPAKNQNGVTIPQRLELSIGRMGC